MRATRRRRPRQLPRINQISDRRSTDQVERRDGPSGEGFLVDTQGFYAPVQVVDEETEGWPTFKESVSKMTRAAEINRAWLPLLHYQGITEEGRQQRLILLRDRWRELFGTALFVVDD